MKKFFVLFLCLMLIGCSSFYYGRPRVYYNALISKEYPPKSQNDEILLLTTIPSRPYKEIGIIKITGIGNDRFEIANKKFIEKAKEVGADAVINIRHELYGIVYGTAILFTDK